MTWKLIADSRYDGRVSAVLVLGDPGEAEQEGWTQIDIQGLPDVAVYALLTPTQAALIEDRDRISVKVEIMRDEQ